MDGDDLDGGGAVIADTAAIMSDDLQCKSFGGHFHKKTTGPPTHQHHVKNSSVFSWLTKLFTRSRNHWSQKY